MSPSRKPDEQLLPGDQASPPTPSLMLEGAALNAQLLDIFPVAVYTCDAHGIIQTYNQAAVTLWGQQPAPGSRWCGAWKVYNLHDTLITPENSVLARLFNGSPSEKEFIVERPDGSKRAATGNAHLLRDASGHITGAINIVQDITEQKFTERKSAHLDAIFQSTDDAIISKTLDGVVNGWNPAAEKLFGYTAAEMVGQHITLLIPEDRLDEEADIIEKLKRGERVDHFETLRLRKDGSLIDISLSISPIRDINGMVIGASKIARDITNQKGDYRIVQESEKKFRLLVKQAPVGITILRGPELVAEIANEIYLQLIDKREEEFVGKKLFEVLPEVKESIESILMDVMRTGKPYYGNEFRVNLRRLGTVRPAYFNFVYQPLREEDGRITGVIVVANDVTQQIESKHAQLEKERSFRRMVMSSPVAMTIWRGKDHVIEMANTAMFKNIWRKEEGDVVGQKALEIFPELNEQKYPELLRDVMQNRVVHQENESLAYIRGNDGMKKFYLDFEYAPLYEADGEVSGVMITVADVTDRVEARQKLEDAEARLRLAAEGTGLATWDLDLQNGTIIHSARLAEIFGFDRSVVMDHKELRARVHPDDEREIVEKAFQLAKLSGVYYYEARIIWPDQSIHWVHTRGHVIFDAQHRPLRMLGTMTDITEQKQALQALKESEERLSIAQEAAELGTWELNINTRAGVYSNRYLHIMGFDHDQQPTHQELIDRVHPEDRAIRNQAMEAAMKNGVLDLEMRILRKNKEVRWIKGRGRVFYDSNGQPERMMGTILDITDQKSAFHSLQESEERFKTVADGAPVMIWMSGSDKFLDFFNTTWLNFTGRSIDEERGEGWLDNVHPADKEVCGRIYSEAFERQQPFHTEYRLRRYDGAYRWISDNAVPRYTPDGSFVGFISACMDIDDEKRINQRLQASELLFKTISTVSPVGLWMTNEKGENNFVNGTWVDWTGVPLYEQYGGGWLKPLLEDDRNKVFDAYKNQSAKLDKFSAEFRFLRFDGSMRWGLSEGFPYFDSEGSFAGYAGSVTDITERKQDELRKNDFLAVASHELKTPITSIKAYTQLLANTYQHSEDVLLKNALSKMENQVNKMSKLVSDFLNLSKIESDKFRLQEEVFPLNELVEEAVEDMQLVSPGYSITANMDASPILIRGDREKIMQVLTNLMINAVKYSPDNKQVEITLKKAAGEATVFVKDRGIGIRPAEYEKIFQRFYRADSNNIQVSGFGIGLYISAEIIRMHGGQIGVERNDDKGSSFYFKLPVA